MKLGHITVIQREIDIKQEDERADGEEGGGYAQVLCETAWEQQGNDLRSLALSIEETIRDLGVCVVR